MPVTSYIEDMINAIKTAVQANINTYLAGIQTAKADGIDTPNFLEVVIDDGDVYNRAKYPSLIIYPMRTSDKALSMGTDVVEIELAFIVSIIHGKKSSAITAIQRYAESFRQLFLDLPSLSGACDYIGENIEINFYPSVPGATDKKIASVIATFYKQISR